METIAQIRRLSLVQGKSIKAICREFNIPRKVGPQGSCGPGETESATSASINSIPRMCAWRDELDRLLSASAGKPQRERMTLIRIYEELRGLGYDGHGEGRAHGLCHSRMFFVRAYRAETPSRA